MSMVALSASVLLRIATVAMDAGILVPSGPSECMRI